MCINCKQGFYLNNLSDSISKICVQGKAEENCLEYYNKGNCKLCKPGYYLKLKQSVTSTNYGCEVLINKNYG